MSADTHLLPKLFPTLKQINSENVNFDMNKYAN